MFDARSIWMVSIKVVFTLSECNGMGIDMGNLTVWRANKLLMDREVYFTSNRVAVAFNKVIYLVNCAI